jgi:hypothetical protein
MSRAYLEFRCKEVRHKQRCLDLTWALAVAAAQAVPALHVIGWPYSQLCLIDMFGYRLRVWGEGIGKVVLNNQLPD